MLRRGLLVVVIIATGAIAAGVWISRSGGARVPADATRSVRQPAHRAVSASKAHQTAAGPSWRTPPQSLARLIGGLIITGATRESTAAQPGLAQLIRNGDVGGVIVTDTSVASSTALVHELQSDAGAGGNPPLLIATDQEGGLVRRYAGIGPAASAAALGRGSPSTTRSQATAAACRLRQQGVTLDLAPVADTATRPDGFIAQEKRSFGATAAITGPNVAAFVHGLENGGVAATLKHFPGLGAAVVSTDTILSERLSDPGVPGAFLAGIQAGAQVVMVSNATYVSGPFTSSMPAFATPAVYRWMRTTGFGGATVTDSLSGAALQSDPRLPDPAVQALAAGADLVLFVDDTGRQARLALSRIHAAVLDGRLSRARLGQAWRRVQEVKLAQMDLASKATCG